MDGVCRTKLAAVSLTLRYVAVRYVTLPPPARQSVTSEDERQLLPVNGSGALLRHTL